MVFMKKRSQNAGLWWVSVVSLSMGIAIFVLLKPAEYDTEVQRYRAMALILSVAITGLCVIIGTRSRWFGKDL
jgi:hypothetical protein